MMKFDTLVDKEENRQTKCYLPQHLKWRIEVYNLNFHQVKIQGQWNARFLHVSRFWCINKGRNRKTETFPSSATKIKGWNLWAKITNNKNSTTLEC